MPQKALGDEIDKGEQVAADDCADNADDDIHNAAETARPGDDPRQPPGKQTYDYERQPADRRRSFLTPLFNNNLTIQTLISFIAPGTCPAYLTASNEVEGSYERDLSARPHILPRPVYDNCRSYSAPDLSLLMLSITISRRRY
jgi:hypothetical protein